MGPVLMVVGGLISAGGWVWLLSGPSLGGDSFGRAVVNIHALTISSQVIHLGYIIAGVGLALHVLEAVRAASERVASIARSADASIEPRRQPYTGDNDQLRAAQLVDTRVISGVEFKIYYDGSVEAETNDGPRRFPSLMHGLQECRPRVLKTEGASNPDRELPRASTDDLSHGNR